MNLAEMDAVFEILLSWPNAKGVPFLFIVPRAEKTCVDQEKECLF